MKKELAAHVICLHMERSRSKTSARWHAKVAQKEAQLSCDNWQQYLQTDLDPVDETATENSAVAYVYTEHVKCIGQPSKKWKEGKRKRREKRVG